MNAQRIGCVPQYIVEWNGPKCVYMSVGVNETCLQMHILSASCLCVWVCVLQSVVDTCAAMNCSVSMKMRDVHDFLT